MFKYILFIKYYSSIVYTMYKYYIYIHLRTRVIRQNKHVFSRKFNRKIKKPIFKPVRAFVLPLPYNYTIFGFKAVRDAKKWQIWHFLTFYIITHQEITQIFRLSRAHTRTYKEKPPSFHNDNG